MAKTVNIEVRLPQQTADEVRAIAKLAGLSPESVIKLAIALDVRRWQREAGTPSQPTSAVLSGHAPKDEQ